MDKTFELKAESSRLQALRTDLRSLLEEAGLGEKAVGDALLAVQEVLTNVIRHAYKGADGKIEVRFQDGQNQVEIMIRDFGEKFDVTKMPDPKLPKTSPGGLGIFLAKKLVDKLSYDSSCEQGNKLHLIKFKS